MTYCFDSVSTLMTTGLLARVAVDNGAIGDTASRLQKVQLLKIGMTFSIRFQALALANEMPVAQRVVRGAIQRSWLATPRFNPQPCLIGWTMLIHVANQIR